MTNLIKSEVLKVTGPAGVAGGRLAVNVALSTPAAHGHQQEVPAVNAGLVWEDYDGPFVGPFVDGAGLAANVGIIQPVDLAWVDLDTGAPDRAGLESYIVANSKLRRFEQLTDQELAQLAETIRPVANAALLPGEWEDYDAAAD